MLNNSMLNYKEYSHKCESCDGTGVIEVTEEELKEYIERCRFRKIGDLLELYRNWEKTGEVPCPECEGAGKWTTLQ